ncbi:hypothetical protein [Halomarina pelagica]|nr:hypothetical protein [Halomarina sp. BND7]
MGRTLHIKVDDDQYEWLSTVKEQRGLTWRGMLIHAAEDLEISDRQ